MALPAAGLADYTTFDFTVIPMDGAAGAPAGDTFGWGYSVTNNDPDNWLALTGLEPTVNFQYVTDIGDIFDYPTIAPGGTLTEPWIQDTQGLYQLTWDPAAPSGYSTTGQFEIDATWYYDDPNACPTCLVDGPAQIVEVTGFTAQVTPEPSPLVMLAGAALCLLAGYRCQYRGRDGRPGRGVLGWLAND